MLATLELSAHPPNTALSREVYVSSRDHQMAGPLEGLRYKGVGTEGREGAFRARVSSS